MSAGQRPSRRAVLAGAALAAIPAPLAADPILDAIRTYREALADFNANSPGDTEGSNAYAELAFFPAIRVLDEWTLPAQTRQGAVEALRLALDEMTDFGNSDIATSMVAAAFAYFENLSN